MIKNRASLFSSSALISLLALSSHAIADQNCVLIGNHPDETRHYIQCLDQTIEDLQRDHKMWVNKLTMDI